ncbi:hypothetical protein [Comamonas composti]|uniref:hypothetical protein n=1 Tax=Comamonas composti TaxID=408558 RepID=UPI0012EBF87D|nr:hypothetical protein [Comamonas composti]
MKQIKSCLSLIRVLSISVCMLFITGCTTMKAIEKSGSEFSEGNVISGLWIGTMGVAMGALMDVFTLGGSMDVEQSSAVWSEAGNAYVQSKNASQSQGAKPAYVPKSESVSTEIRQSSLPLIEAPTRVSAEPVITGGINDQGKKLTSQENSQPSQLRGGSTQSNKFRTAGSCVSMVRRTQYSKGIDGIHNGCSFNIFARYCHSGGCYVEWGISGIRPGTKVAIVPFQGSYKVAACEYPGSPKNPVTGDSWKGQSDFVCG